jgi:hypothetical protein
MMTQEFLWHREARFVYRGWMKVRVYDYVIKIRKSHHVDPYHM